MVLFLLAGVIIEATELEGAKRRQQFETRKNKVVRYATVP
jgi:hypothetical protein